MRCLSLLWLACLLSIAAGKETRGRYVPRGDSTHPDDKDHRALQSNNNRVLGIAYECNDNNFELPQGRMRNYAPGDIIRVCIKPEKRTENRGIVMRSVDSMNFMGGSSGISQKVIDFQKETFGTLALCLPGQLVCSFRTKLQEELFWGLEGAEVNITGVAMATMEYIDESYALNGLADTDIPIELKFMVRRIAPPPGVILGGSKGGEEEICDPKWWCNYPLWFKIFLLILLFIILCCCCALCVTCPCMIKEMFQDDREREERRRFVKEQQFRSERGSFANYPEEEYFANSYRSSSFRQQPPPPPSQGSYRQPPPPPPPPQPARQSSYRVPRAESSSFRAQQHPSQRSQYEY